MSTAQRFGWKTSVALAAVAIVSVAAFLPGSATAQARVSRDAAAARTTAPLVVDSTDVVRPINRGLLGFHGRYDAATITGSFGPYGPTTQRHVMSAHDFMEYDCTTRKIAPGSIEYFSSWIDAVTAKGARPILSLSYVPPCFARNGQPKGPPSDVAGYRAFLNELLRSLVTDRVAAGEEPLRWLELWNEPDIPIDPGNPGAGHGYVGTLDEFLALNLPSLVGAILQTEAESKIDLHIGTPATFAPWSFGSAYGDLASMLEHVNGFDPTTAQAMAGTLGTALGPDTVAAIEHNGGFTWPRAVIDAAATLGLDLDFVAVHFYPNNPLQGVRFPEPDRPALLEGRNPFASPDQFAELARLWQAEFPGMEINVTEWALSAGAEARSGTCEAASFDAAVLSVLQTTSIARAMYLGLPWGVEDAPFRAWNALPPGQVRVDGELGSNVWSTAATGEGRTTLLLSQWHSRLTDAKDLRVPVEVTGLADGSYTVTVETIGQDSAPAASRTETVAVSNGGRLVVDGDVALRGQSIARVDIRGAGIAALPALTAADRSGVAQRCLTQGAPDTPSTTPGSTVDAAPHAPSTAHASGASVASAAHPVAASPRYTG